MKNSQEHTSVREYGVYSTTGKHSVNLRRNPTLHFQIGLVLALLASLFFIEMRMPEEKAFVQTQPLDDEPLMWSEVVRVEKIQVEKPVEKQRSTPPPQQQQPDEWDVRKNSEKDIVESFIDPVDPTTDDPIVDPGSVELYDPVEAPEDVAFVLIEEVPLFPGCEGLNSNEERRACMSSKISKHVNRKFNADIGEGLGLEGRNKIFVQFTIDKTGHVTAIKSRGPHTKLEKEAERVVKLLPKMEPGKQRKVPVGVIYTLPITLDLKY